MATQLCLPFTCINPVGRPSAFHLDQQLPPHHVHATAQGRCSASRRHSPMHAAQGSSFTHSIKPFFLIPSSLPRTTAESSEFWQSEARGRVTSVANLSQTTAPLNPSILYLQEKRQLPAPHHVVLNILCNHQTIPPFFHSELAISSTPTNLPTFLPRFYRQHGQEGLFRLHLDWP